MVFAHITVRQYVVAQLLRVAQPGTVTQHQPRMRTQHRDMVGDRLGIGGSDADVDHRDAAAVATHQMIAGHLRQMRRRDAQIIARLHGLADASLDQVAGLDEGDIVVFIGRCLRVGGAAHDCMPEPNEFVDVKLVVGKQHEILEVLGPAAGVVTQPLQRIIDPRRGEQRQRLRLAGRRLIRAVGDAVVHRGQVGQVEQVAHRHAPLGTHAAFDVVGLGKGKMNRNRLRAGTDLQLHQLIASMIFQQQAKLLLIVICEQVRSRQRGLECAGAGHEAVREARIGARHRIGMHAHKRIACPHALREAFAADETLQVIAQVADAAVVNRTHLLQCRGRIVKTGGCNEMGIKQSVAPGLDKWRAAC